MGELHTQRAVLAPTLQDGARYSVDIPAKTYFKKKQGDFNSQSNRAVLGYAWESDSWGNSQYCIAVQESTMLHPAPYAPAPYLTCTMPHVDHAAPAPCHILLSWPDSTASPHSSVTR